MNCYKLPSVVLTVIFITSVVETKNITNGKGCYYKGTFHQGNWTDGCDFNCTCLDIETGHYKCKTRCPVYPELPQGCVLKLPVGEKCCRQPDCSAVTVPYTIVTSNNGGYNKNNSKSKISDNRNSNKNNNTSNDNGNNDDNLSDNGNNNTDNVKSNSNGNGNNNNSSYNSDNGISNTNSDKVISYNEINNNNINKDKNNKNKQNYISNQYSNESSTIRDTGDFNTTFNNNDFNNIDISLNNSEGVQQGCLYKGVYHYDNWTDGCNLNCTCEDPVLGVYRCNKRCREYPNLDPGCILKLSPEDECCRVLECNFTELIKQLENSNFSNAINITENYTNNINTKHELYTGNEYSYGATYTGNVGHVPNDANTDITVTEDNKATVTPTTLPPIIVASAKTSTSFPKMDLYNPRMTESGTMIDKERKGYDVFNDTNKDHIGDSETLNATETEKLAIIFSRFGPIRLFTVKKDVNIKSKNKDKLQNEIHNVTEVFKHGPRQSIIQTKNFARDISYLLKEGVCQYKGKKFQQDESWHDGCDLTCVCDDASRGTYKCRSRCTEYKALPIGCIMRKSHVDSCCLVPDCRQATFANGNKMLTTSRIFSKFQQIGNTEHSLLKQLFNQRNQMRNKPSFLNKDKIASVAEIANHFQDVPIVIKASDLDRRRNLQNAIDHTKESNTDLQNDNKLANAYLQNMDANLQILQRRRPTAKQQIVTPYNLIHSSRKISKSSDTHRRYNDPMKLVHDFRDRSFRTIATQTGLYKVRKKDGVVTSSHSNSVTNNAINRGSGVSSNENKDHNRITPAYCEHRNVRYNEGHKLYDGCERTCVCQSNGQFICKQRCPGYRSVPTGCALLSPRPGQCCSTLVCTRIPTRNNPPASYSNN